MNPLVWPVKLAAWLVKEIISGILRIVLWIVVLAAAGYFLGSRL